VIDFNLRETPQLQPSKPFWKNNRKKTKKKRLGRKKNQRSKLKLTPKLQRHKHKLMLKLKR
jgi:hypothetical protein